MWLRQADIVEISRAGEEVKSQEKSVKHNDVRELGEPGSRPGDSCPLVEARLTRSGPARLPMGPLGSEPGSGLTHNDDFLLPTGERELAVVWTGCVGVCEGVVVRVSYRIHRGRSEPLGRPCHVVHVFASRGEIRDPGGTRTLRSLGLNPENRQEGRVGGPLRGVQRRGVESKGTSPFGAG
jgi:hypothetical protein